MEEPLELVAEFAGPILLMVGWFLFRGKNHARRSLLVVWAITTLYYLVRAASVSSLGRTDGIEMSYLGEFVFTSSLTWFSGPALIWSIEKEYNPLWSVLALVVLAPPALFVCIILLGATGHVWGM